MTNRSMGVAKTLGGALIGLAVSTYPLTRLIAPLGGIVWSVGRDGRMALACYGVVGMLGLVLTALSMRRSSTGGFLVGMRTGLAIALVIASVLSALLFLSI